MPLLDPEQQFFFCSQKSRQHEGSKNSFFMKYLPIASQNLKKNHETIKSHQNFRRDFLESINFLNHEFQLDIPASKEVEKLHILDYYNYFYHFFKKKEEKIIGKYFSLTLKTTIHCFELFNQFEQSRTWFFMSSSFAVLAINNLLSNNISAKEVAMLINLEADIMKAAGFTLVLCYYINSVDKNHNAIFDLVRKGIFSEIHINLDLHSYDYLPIFDEIIREISSITYSNFDYLDYNYGYLNLYLCFSPKIANNVEVLNDPRPFFNIFYYSLELINVFHEPKIEYIKPFVYCEIGFKTDILQVNLCHIPLFEDKYEKNDISPSAISGIESAFVSKDDFLIYNGSRAEVIFENNDTKYVNFSDLHFMNSELYVEDTLYTIKADKDSLNMISKIQAKSKELLFKNDGQFYQQKISTLFSSDKKIILKGLTYLSYAIKCFREFDLHRNQLFAIFEACTSCLFNDKMPEKGIVYQLDTGEGKSIIIQVIASLLALNGKVVHIATSNIHLSNRDYSESFKFFNQLGIKSAVLLHYNELPYISLNNEYVKNSNISRDFYPSEYFDEKLFSNSSSMNLYVCGIGDKCEEINTDVKIVYSTFINFEALYLKMIESWSPANVEKYFNKCSLIIDEADTILIDELTNGTILSRPMLSNADEILPYVYMRKVKDKITAEFVLKEVRQKWPECQDMELTDIEKMYKEIDLVNTPEFVNGKKYSIETIKDPQGRKPKSKKAYNLSRGISKIINYQQEIKNALINKILGNNNKREVVDTNDIAISAEESNDTNDIDVEKSQKENINDVDKSQNEDTNNTKNSDTIETGSKKKRKKYKKKYKKHKNNRNPHGMTDEEVKKLLASNVEDHNIEIPVEDALEMIEKENREIEKIKRETDPNRQLLESQKEQSAPIPEQQNTDNTNQQPAQTDQNQINYPGDVKKNSKKKMIVYDKKIIVPFDYDNKGVLEPNKEFSGFIQQFIAIKEMQNDPKENENMMIKEISLNYLYASHPIFVKLYHNVVGFTGTIGNQFDEAVLANQYNLKTFKVPRNKPNLRVQLPNILCQTLEERNQKIFEEIIYFNRAKIPVLVVFQDLADIHMIKNQFESYGLLNINVFDGRNEKDKPEEIAGLDGAISFGTNFCGRGTDIKFKGKPLHVIVAYYSTNVRVMFQAYGRTARQGNEGTCRVICVGSQYIQPTQLLAKSDMETVLKEFIFKNNKQSEFIEHYRSRYNWLFSHSVEPQSIDPDDVKKLKESRINVNRMTACNYKFPICMKIDTFLSIQSQKIFSLYNCPNSKFTWRLFQRYFREMILESWSLLVDEVEQEYYISDNDSIRRKYSYDEYLSLKMAVTYKKINEYIPLTKKKGMINTFIGIYEKVIENWSRKFDKMYNSKFLIKKKSLFSRSFISINFGFMPFSLMDNSGVKINNFDGDEQNNYIKDPEISYFKLQKDGKTKIWASITDKVDGIFDSICSTINSVIGGYIGLRFFMRRTIAGIEIGVCVDFDIANIDDSILGQNCLIDKDPLFLFTIQIKSLIPIFAGVLVIIAVFAAKLSTLIFDNVSKIIRKFVKMGLKVTVLTGLKLLAKAGLQSQMEALLSGIVSVLCLKLDVQIANISKYDSEMASKFKNFSTIFIRNEFKPISEKLHTILGKCFTLKSGINSLITDVLPMSGLIRLAFVLVLSLIAFFMNFRNRKAIQNNKQISEKDEQKDMLSSSRNNFDIEAKTDQFEKNPDPQAFIKSNEQVIDSIYHIDFSDEADIDDDDK